MKFSPTCGDTLKLLFRRVPNFIVSRHFIAAVTHPRRFYDIFPDSSRENLATYEILLLVGGRAAQKQPTKVRAKQPKSPKKVKFISEYQTMIGV